MGPALRLAPLGRKLPLPGRLRVMTEIAPPWRSTERPEKKYARAWRDARTCRHSHRLCPVGGVRVGQRGHGTRPRRRRLRGRGAGTGLLRRALVARGTGRRGPRFRPARDRGVRGRRDRDREHVGVRLASEGARARARRRSRLGGARSSILPARAGPGRVPRGRRHPARPATRSTSRSRCRTPAISGTPSDSRSRLRCRSGGFPASRWSSPPSRTSAAGAPGSTTSPSPTRPASSATARPRTSSRRAPRSTRARTRAASSRSRRRSAGRGARCPALHPIEIVDASIRNLGAAGLLRDARR